MSRFFLCDKSSYPTLISVSTLGLSTKCHDVGIEALNLYKNTDIIVRICKKHCIIQSYYIYLQ